MVEYPGTTYTTSALSQRDEIRIVPVITAEEPLIRSHASAEIYSGRYLRKQYIHAKT